ncbi:MAG: dihydroneopterin aldolase [Actinomycetota bacterium]
MDVIRIRGLRVDTHIGVTAEERARPQTVVVDVEVHTDLTRAGRSDELSHTIDYGHLVQRVAEAVRSAEARLLEHVAEEVAALVRGLEGVTGVAVEVGKASPPLSEELERVSVRIERGGS